jgi:hypothetical protein
MLLAECGCAGPIFQASLRMCSIVQPEWRRWLEGVCLGIVVCLRFPLIRKWTARSRLCVKSRRRGRSARRSDRVASNSARRRSPRVPTWASIQSRSICVPLALANVQLDAPQHRDDNLRHVDLASGAIDDTGIILTPVMRPTGSEALTSTRPASCRKIVEDRYGAGSIGITSRFRSTANDMICVRPTPSLTASSTKPIAF